MVLAKKESVEATKESFRPAVLESSEENRWKRVFKLSIISTLAPCRKKSTT